MVSPSQKTVTASGSYLIILSFYSSCCQSLDDILLEEYVYEQNRKYNQCNGRSHQTEVCTVLGADRIQ